MVQRWFPFVDKAYHEYTHSVWTAWICTAAVVLHAKRTCQQKSNHPRIPLHWADEQIRWHQVGDSLYAAPNLLDGHAPSVMRVAVKSITRNSHSLYLPCTRYGSCHGLHVCPSQQPCRVAVVAIAHHACTTCMCAALQSTVYRSQGIPFESLA